ncbi:DUF2235 domain-containing protein [Acidiphilium sp. C61]|jgi:uncharacterized protein (DUF2235 family)|uniref:DUF2235 domain-containing protein n=1 Tax=Acidiphilium sp. C61 TaxID=1671485 RepID=UPI00157B1DA7|nr:DUF2235 domain-containing protein [Acidiphilium sp. C61]
MSKNIVICCDGTGDQIEATQTNVLKLFRILEKTDNQVVYYSPGVGTVGAFDTWQQLKSDVKEFLGVVAGYGLDDAVLDAYRFLCSQYEPGDAIWLFGFSRGAYEVRVLAAFIYVIGLLPPAQLNLAGYAFTAFKKASRDSHRTRRVEDQAALRAAAPEAEVAAGLPAAWEFRRVAGGRPVTIRFVGVWDTVSAVIVPRRDRLLPDFQTLRFTRTDPGVAIFRQAISIDERRRMFRLLPWREPQTFKPDPFSDSGRTAQDTRQVWFAGVHADVGGGYPEAESGASKYPLLWMIEQARHAGLQINDAMLDEVARGEARAGARRVYAAPSPEAKLHDSLKGFWWLFEIIPKRLKWREWPGRAGFLGVYLPLGEPRLIPDDALIHRSVAARMACVPAYRPVNMPKTPDWTD